MSLHTLANHMSAHGRGPDTTLVHMSPREVHGLQALAMAHGGSLTINPHTGLPEAGFLENLLPAIAGFALNAFAPGVGGAVGSALGLTGAAASTVGSGLLVGGATSLFTGSLEKGLMAGLGAYGGAGLGSSLSGAPSATMDAASGARDAGMSAAAEVSPSATAARLQSGVNTAMSAPVDFMKDNVFNFGLAAAPALAGTFDDQQTSNAPKRQSGNLYRYKKDPATGQSYAYETYSGDDVKNAPPMVWGNASGGLMQHYDAGGPVRFGNVGDPVDANGNPILPSTKDTRSDSERAQDYLMGKGPNPFLFYHKDAAPVDPIKKAAEATKSLQEEIAKGPTESRGLSQEQRDEKNDPNSWANQSPEAKAQYYAANPGMASFVRFGQDVVGLTPLGQLQQKTMPGFYEREKALTYGISPSSGLSYVTPAPYLRGNTPVTPSSEAVQYNVNQPGLFDGMDRGSTLNAQAARAEQNARIAAFDASREGSRGGGGGAGNDAGGGSRDAGPATGDRGYGSQGQHAAYGGLLDSRYADGGVTGGGSLDLHVPINLGGGQGGGGSFGGGFGGGNGIQQGGTPQQPSMGGLAGLLGGLDSNAVNANPQGFSNFLQGAMNQERTRPGSTMLGSPNGAVPQGGYSAGYNNYGMGNGNPSVGLHAGYFPSENQGSPTSRMAAGGITALAQGGMYNLGSYSDGGRLLRGPGDGVSDDIPATIGQNQPARLADGEFVVPARIVSELGNGSTEAGARKLYAMMDRVQKSRSKTTGKDKVAANSRADKYLPA